MFGVQPNVLVASKDSGFKTVADLIAAAKAKPGALTFASAGIGSASHIGGGRGGVFAPISVCDVAGLGGGVAAGRGGAGAFYFFSLAAAASALGSGKLTVLAVSSPKRAALLPDAPSIVEAGYPNATFRFWVGLSAPAKTPKPIVAKLHDATEKALQDPGLKDRLAKLG